MLGCERKRAAYDRFGKEGLSEGGEGGRIDTSRSGFGGGGASFFGSGSDALREFFGIDRARMEAAFVGRG